MKQSINTKHYLPTHISLKVYNKTISDPPFAQQPYYNFNNNGKHTFSKRNSFRARVNGDFGKEIVYLCFEMCGRGERE